MIHVDEEWNQGAADSSYIISDVWKDYEDKTMRNLRTTSISVRHNYKREKRRR